VYLADKRWLDRKEHWVRKAALINPSEYGVDGVREKNAKAFIIQHHYSGTMVAARLCVGLYRKTGVDPSRLVGVAAFSVPMQGAAITRYTGFDANQGVELGRFVLLPEVAFNGETWFLSRATKLLKQEKGGPRGVRSVISYADPLERRSTEGLLTKPAHAGQIYQASNAIYGGRSRAQYLWMTREGRVLSRRSLNKIINEEVGQAYASRQLEAAGAPTRALLESPKEWVARVLPLIGTRIKHPGNYVFAYGLDGQARDQVRHVNAGGQPYPKVSTQVAIFDQDCEIAI
jgi:hypothetical protein